MKVLGCFCEAGKKGRSSLVGTTNKSCHMLHACSNIKFSDGQVSHVITYSFLWVQGFKDFNTCHHGCWLNLATTILHYGVYFIIIIIQY